MNLQGRTVLVTGGASGLGGAVVDMVVAAGGHAVMLDLNDEITKEIVVTKGGAVVHPRVRQPAGV